jgi:hypothetical protein
VVVDSVALLEKRALRSEHLGPVLIVEYPVATSQKACQVVVDRVAVPGNANCRLEELLPWERPVAIVEKLPSWGLSALLVEASPSLLTSKLSWNANSKATHGRLGLVDAILGIHLLLGLPLSAQPVFLPNTETHGLVASRRHGLAEVNLLVGMAAIVLVVADHHESTLSH